MSGRRAAEDAHGLSRAEEIIVEMIESGMDRDAIAAGIDRKRSYIDFLADRYVMNEHQLGGFDRMVRRGDARYQAALVASGGTYR